MRVTGQHRGHLLVRTLINVSGQLILALGLSCWAVAVGPVATRAQEPDSAGQSGSIRLSASEVFSIDSIFSSYDHTWSPGCALGVVRAGRLIFSRGYGMANLEHNIALSDRSVFRIGSVSKQFTAAAIALLAQDGALSLDDDVRRFLPELPAYDRPITIRHFLNHTSGIRDYLTLMDLAGYRDDDWYTDRDVIDMLVRQEELNFAPGDEYLYSNAGYFLLSHIVQRASGRSLREFAGDRIFGPLGMADSHFHDDHEHVVPARASGYAPSGENDFRIAMTTLDMVGDGGVYTTVRDLARWDENFYEPRVGGRRLLDDLHERGVLANGDTLTYALGNTVTEYRGLQLVHHGGSFVGFRAHLMRFPTERTSIICLCNLSTTNPARLSFTVADVVLADRLGQRQAPGRADGEGPIDAAGTSSVTGSTLRHFAGDYYARELDAVYDIAFDGDGLVLTVGNGLDGPLEYLGDDRFARGRLRLRFWRDDDQVTGFLLDAGRVKNLRFERVTAGRR